MINFGAKIPVAECKLIKRSSNTPVNATIYELDCKDFNDFRELDRAKGQWYFRTYMQNDMISKYGIYNLTSKDNGNSFYITEDSKGEILAMAETNRYNDSIDINLIESQKDKKYKYAGSAIIAVLGLKVLERNEGKKLGVNSPIDSAVPFYTKVCGFKKTSTLYLEMQMKKIKKFVKKLQKITEINLIN